MIPDQRFLEQPKHFWANVRTIGQYVGYSKKGDVIVPSMDDILKAYHKIDLSTHHLVNANNTPTRFGRDLIQYFEYRAEVLNTYVEPRLMDAKKAKAEFNKLKRQLNPKCPLPMNKQRGEKKEHAFFTCIINMIVEANTNGLPCNFDPRELTTITQDGQPLRTLARRVDGAFPSVVNPISIWEIKEYYYTTTFGSRVAGGVYETLLDGMELEELSEHEQIKIIHLLMIDAHFTWWNMGKPYLCRIIDMLHMGYVDEVLFGSEVTERLPEIVQGWVVAYHNQHR
ncbi:MAG: hypothetical protein JKY96_09375 [Phycisphaerales bacterium]|nr:hypothetical protein [Phycisphaerales bacterium]